MILAQMNLPLEGLHRRLEWARIQSERDWVLPILAAIVMLVFVVAMYRRDSVELRPFWRWFLTSLRLLSFAGLLLVYLQPQIANEHQKVENSRVLLLVDTSLSMSRHDTDNSPVPAEPSRSQQVIDGLTGGTFLADLRAVHDVTVMRFDHDLTRVATFPKLAPPGPPSSNSPTAAEKEKTTFKTDPSQVKWEEELAPRGSETRVGQALRQGIYEERSAPLAGAVLFSDGQHNAGLDPAAAVQMAREAGVPVFTVAIGSDRKPVEVRIADFEVPSRAYPGDKFTVKGHVQAQGLAARTVAVELWARDSSGPVPSDQNAGQLEGVEQVILGDDGEIVPVKFEITPAAIGRRTFRLLVKAPREDADTRNNLREADVEVVDRKSRILLFAGGPAHEYQFLRNLLNRDKDVEVDVFLQTGVEPISQDAHAILDEFPSTRDELFDYDTIVAFDPAWQELTGEQIDLVEKWVAEQAGGLIVVAGPIYTDSWAHDPGMAKVRALYPVEFNKRLSLLNDSEFGSKEPWPLEFTREGLEAEFLWLEDTATASREAWETFRGVYGYYAVRGEKQGATAYAYYSDPQAASGGKKPVYFAGQFYGAGQVFYLGSGEMRRLRRHNEAWFERFYTKLIRHVSQGRLQRGSKRGLLLTDNARYVLGDTVDVRAQLTDARLDPLTVASVPLEILLPDTTPQTINLTLDPARQGNYRGQFTVRKEGRYRLELPVPESDDERLNRDVEVRIPQLESERMERNDALLGQLARDTKGDYYKGMKEALGQVPGKEPLVKRLTDHKRTITLSGTPDRLWDNQWVLYVLCGLLCTEWLARRLLRLA